MKPTLSSDQKETGSKDSDNLGLALKPLRRSKRHKSNGPANLSVNGIITTVNDMASVVSSEDSSAMPPVPMESFPDAAVAMETDTPVHNESSETAKDAISTGAEDPLPSNNVNELFRAASTGDTNRLRQLIHSGVDVKSCDSEDKGNSALMKAAGAGHAECVQLLLEAKSDVGLRNADGQTPLSLVCQSGSVACLELLMEAGARIDPLSKHGNMISQNVMRVENVDILRYLLDLNAVSKKNFSSMLFQAIKNNAKDIVYLLGEYIEPQKLNSMKQGVLTPLQCAAKTNSVDVIKPLVHFGADAIKYNIDSALQIACKEGHTQFFKVLISFYPKRDLNLKFREGLTCLAVASKAGSHEVVKFLLEAGAQIDIQDNKGFTPFLHACMEGHWEILKELLASGCNINHQDFNERDSALMWALSFEEEQHTDLAKFLIEKGADLELQDKHKNTALCIAAEVGNYRAVELLLQKGAKLEHANSFGVTPFGLACCSNSCSSSCIVRKLLDEGANINHQNKHGKSPIMLAAMARSLHVFSSLLNSNVDLDLKDENGESLVELLLHRMKYYAYNYMYVCKKMLSQLIAHKMYLSGRNLQLMILYDKYWTYMEEAIANCECYPSSEHFYGEYESDKVLLYLGERDMTPFSSALYVGNADLARFFIANWFLHWNDVATVQSSARQSTDKLIKDINKQPWSLTSLSFIKVSTCLGFDSKRRSRVEKSGLCKPWQDKLLFKTPLWEVLNKRDSDWYVVQSRYLEYIHDSKCVLYNQR